MNKLIKYSVAMLSFFALTVSCVDDNGNYDYRNIPPIELSSESFNEKYVCEQLEVLSINPEVSKDGSTSDFSYNWRLSQIDITPDQVTGKYIDQDVSQSKDLSLKVTVPPGKYRLIFSVYSKTDNVYEQFVAELQVLPIAQIGLAVLHGKDGYSEVSILANDKVNQNLPYERLQHNVFEPTNGKKIEGNPLYIHPRYKTLHVFTDKTGYRTSHQDLTILQPYSELFFVPLEAQQIKFGAFGTWGYNELMINDGGLYYASQASPAILTKFGVKCFGVDYYAAPFVATQYNWAYFGVIYDMKNRRFVSINSQQLMKTFKEPSASAAFDMNNVGKDIVYAEHGYNKYWYCVMQDIDAKSGRALYVSNFMKNDEGDAAKAKYSMTNCENIENANYFAVGNRGEVFYYADDTKVYQFEYAKAALNSTVRIDLSQLGYADYKITALTMFKVDKHSFDSKLMFVGIYNELSGEGKLLQIDVSEVTGEVATQSIKAYDGFGRIASMNYKPE